MLRRWSLGGRLINHDVGDSTVTAVVFQNAELFELVGLFSGDGLEMAVPYVMDAELFRLVEVYLGDSLKMAIGNWISVWY